MLNRLLLADSGMTNPSLLRGAQTGDGQPTSPAAGVVPILKQIGEGQLKVVGTGFFVNPLVQKSLDVVRVIGNEAVHPGVMDLKDDRDTATKLFILAYQERPPGSAGEAVEV